MPKYTLIYPDLSQLTSYKLTSMYINFPQITLTYLILYQFTSMYSMPLKVMAGSCFQSFLVMYPFSNSSFLYQGSELTRWKSQYKWRKGEFWNLKTKSQYFKKVWKLKDISFWYRTIDMSNKSVGVDGRGLGWHEVGMDPKWWTFIPILSQHPND